MKLKKYCLSVVFLSVLNLLPGVVAVNAQERTKL